MAEAARSAVDAYLDVALFDAECGCDFFVVDFGYLLDLKVVIARA